MSLINERNIAKVRTVYNLSCEEFGELMNVTGRFVSHVERGTRNLPNKRAKLIEEKLEMTPEKLQWVLQIYEEINSVKILIKQRSCFA